MLEEHPHHVRKRKALLYTGLVALVLIVVLIITYTTQGSTYRTNAGERLEHFYTTTIDNAQSYFDAQ